MVDAVEKNFLFRMKALFICLLTCLPLLSAFDVALASETAAKKNRTTLVFTTFPSKGMGELATQILAEAYDRIGYDITVQRVPAARALVMANSGAVDGECLRIPVIEAQNPDLIRVPTPIYLNTVVAFSKKSSIDTSRGWEGLRPYKLGSVRGYKFIEKMTADMDRSLYGDYENLFIMLGGSRIQVAVAEYLEALPAFKRVHPHGVLVLDPPLARKEMYHYLHRKNGALVPLIDQVLRQMKEEGRFEAIRNEMIAGFEAR